MECKNKNCKRILPEGYKHKYCENCRNEHVYNLKRIGKSALSCAAAVVPIVIGVVTKGKISSKK